MFLEWMTEAHSLTRSSFYSGNYIPVPDCWSRFEVPYGLHVEMPTVIHCWGMEMGRSPYFEHQTAFQRGQVAHCLWSAFFYPLGA